LRGSYGTTGNDQITDYQYLSSYNAVSSSYQGFTGLTPARIYNPFFSWETVKKLEGGLDIGIWRDRITFSASYYRNRSSNQLVAYPLPGLAGFPTVQANSPATVENAGEEFTLNTINLKKHNFSWTTSINLTLPKNKLVAYPNLATSPNFNLVIGKPLTIQRAYYSPGVDPQTGIYTFTTKNSNGIPSFPGDIAYLKPITQTLYGGIENIFSYKQFQLDVLFQFTKQNSFNYLNSFAPPGFADQNEPSKVMTRWEKPGDKSDVQQFSQDPGSVASNAYSSMTGYPGSNRSISDASFIRVKNLVISYKIPTQWQKKAHLQAARIYFQCQNLVTLTKYDVLDPETGGLNLPPLRTITGGIQVSL